MFLGACFSTIGNAFFKNKVFSDRVRNRDNCPKGLSLLYLLLTCFMDLLTRGLISISTLWGSGEFDLFKMIAS